MATKNYDSEDTQYLNSEDEATELTTNSPKQTAAPQTEPAAAAPQTTKSGHSWRNTAVSAGAGVLIGSAIPVFTSMIREEDAAAQAGNGNGDEAQVNEQTAETGEQATAPNHSEVLSHPELVDDVVPVATTVSSDMSFGQAFAAARAEVGPGGVFEWHGNLYGTYTAEEWNRMSAAEKADYGDHFAWNKIDHHHSDVAPQEHQVADNTPAAADDDIVVTHVDHPSDAQHNDDLLATAEEPATGGDDAEVVVLGVTHDDESGMNVGGIVVDGHEIVLVDVDGDTTFDFAVEDVNHNGQLDEQDSIQDISNENITVDMLQHNPADNYIADAGMDSGNEGGYEA